MGLARGRRHGGNRTVHVHPSLRDRSRTDRPSGCATRSRGEPDSLERGSSFRQGRDVAGGSIQQSFSDTCSGRGIIPRPAPGVLVPEPAAQWDQAIAVPPQQLAMWQQQMQMMESFHQDMILMVQMFVALHREHRVTIRDELDRVQKLTKKLSVLQAKLTQTAGSAEQSRSPALSGRRKMSEKPIARVATAQLELKTSRHPTTLKTSRHPTTLNAARTSQLSRPTRFAVPELVTRYHPAPITPEKP